MAKRRNGFSVGEVTTGLTVMAVLTGLMIPSYNGYKSNLSKQMHVLNVMTLTQVVQNLVLEGVIERPPLNGSITVPLSLVLAQDAVSEVVDPDSKDKSGYGPDTEVQVVNNGGVLEVYVRLSSADHPEHHYVDTRVEEHEIGAHPDHIPPPAHRIDPHHIESFR